MGDIGYWDKDCEIYELSNEVGNYISTQISPRPTMPINSKHTRFIKDDEDELYAIFTVEDISNDWELGEIRYRPDFGEWGFFCLSDGDSAYIPIHHDNLRDILDFVVKANKEAEKQERLL